MGAPQAFLISFKLETNANILAAKAAGSIVKYGVDAVCSNTLQSNRDWVTIVSKDYGATEGIKIAKSDIAGDETSPIEVSGICSQHVERDVKDDGAVIDEPLVQAVVAQHAKHMSASESVGS